MTRVGVVACIWMAVAIGGGVANAAPAAKPVVVVRASGSDTVAAYDEAAKLLASADKPGTAGAVRIRLYAEAEERVVDALANVKKLKGNGGWRNGLMYRIAAGETLTEEALLHRLDAMRTRAKAAYADLAAKQPIAKQPVAKQPTAKAPTTKQPTAPRELPACPEGLTRCFGIEEKCTNLLKNIEHCGDCSTDCTFARMKANAEGVACVQGTCIPRCAEHAKVCNEACTDLYYNTSNCGRCGHECPAGKSCDAGKCSQ